MESRHCGQDKIIFFCPVHNASTPCSLQAFGIRCIVLYNCVTETRLRLVLAITGGTPPRKLVDNWRLIFSTSFAIGLQTSIAATPGHYFYKGQS